MGKRVAAGRREEGSSKAQMHQPAIGHDGGGKGEGGSSVADKARMH